MTDFVVAPVGGHRDRATTGAGRGMDNALFAGGGFGYWAVDWIVK